MGEQEHGGVAVGRALEALGVERVFTLSGGHIFPILDGCHRVGIDLVDVRHEQTAAFAAEGSARLTRKVGVCSVTAGPGVTNVISPLVQASFNGAPLLALGGRAPVFRWGQGSLQEIDHLPFVSPVAHARTLGATEEIGRAVIEAAAAALSPPRKPAFLDFPLEVLFNNADVEIPKPPLAETPRLDPHAVETIGRAIVDAERPVVIAGSNVWLDGAAPELRSLVEKARLPVYMNGQGRGCLAADHELSFSRSRSRALMGADLVMIVGAPIDFRLGFGQIFAPDATVVHVDSHPDLLATHVPLAAGLGAPLEAALAAVCDSIATSSNHREWIEALRAAESEKAAAARAELDTDQTPIHPLRIYGELVPLLERDAIVIGDGGDFVSYAGREVPSFEGGRWLDPGPYGCLGCGPGYAIAARLADPGAQVVLLMGDGAIGFAGMELETMVRHGLAITIIVGNNGIWGLEKHPMRALYGYDVAADLRPGIRYDEMMMAFGGRGELVTDPGAIGPALKRALSSGEPYLVNVLTDPSVAYPRSANLA